MIMFFFAPFDQQMYLIDLDEKDTDLNNYINLVFQEELFSAGVERPNMRVVGNAEYGLIFYRDKPKFKFRNEGKMVMNVMDWEKDGSMNTKDPP